MTKSQLIDALAQALGQSKSESEKTLDAVQETIGSALKKGEKLDWRGFGVFKVREAKARQARNPRTGEMVQVAAKRVATFKPGKELAASLNEDTTTASA